VGAAINPSDEIKLISGDNDDNKPIKIIQDILSIEEIYITLCLIDGKNIR
jgi:hypothetical protein